MSLRSVRCPGRKPLGVLFCEAEIEPRRQAKMLMESGLTAFDVHANVLQLDEPIDCGTTN